MEVSLNSVYLAEKDLWVLRGREFDSHALPPILAVHLTQTLKNIKY